MGVQVETTIYFVSGGSLVSLAAAFWAVTQRSPPKEAVERCVTAQKTAARETSGSCSSIVVLTTSPRGGCSHI